MIHLQRFAAAGARALVRSVKPVNLLKLPKVQVPKPLPNPMQTSQLPMPPPPIRHTSLEAIQEARQFFDPLIKNDKGVKACAERFHTNPVRMDEFMPRYYANLARQDARVIPIKTETQETAGLMELYVSAPKKEIEISGLVSPQYQHRGLFSTAYGKMTRELKAITQDSEVKDWTVTLHVKQGNIPAKKAAESVAHAIKLDIPELKVTIQSTM